MNIKRYGYRVLLSLLWLGTAALPLSQAHAKSYPQKPITVVVPFPAGGGVDVVGRILAEQITRQSGANVIIDNRAGAGGTIGVASASRSSPDGYTATFGSPGNISIAPSVYPNLAYDPAKDLKSVAMAVEVPILILARPGAPFSNVEELIEHAKQNPATLTYGSGGVGTSLHLAGELFASMADIDVLHIPYKGSSPALIDLVGGRIDFMFIDTSAIATVTSGQANLLAITNATRSPLLPDTPTVAESGLSDYEASNWYGLFVPAATDDDKVQWLSQQVIQALQNPDVQERLKAQMLLPAPEQSPEEIDRFISDDIAKWSSVAGSLDLSQ